MGGSKNKSPSQKEKSQNAKSTKKTKSGKSDGGAPKADITVMLTEQQASKALKSIKVITVQELARHTGVKISTANAFLKDAVKKGTVKISGGHGGHFIYQTL